MLSVLKVLILQQSQQMSNFQRKYPSLVLQHEPGSKNQWSQMVWVRVIKIYIQVVHIPNNVYMKRHIFSLKSVSFTAFVANVIFPLKIWFLTCITWAWFKEPWSQTVWVRVIKIYIQVVHIPNNVYIKGHVVCLKSVSFITFAANVKFLPKIWFLSRTTWAWFKEPVIPNGLN